MDGSKGPAQDGRPIARRLGRYELQGVIGTGGFATVYRAIDPSLAAVVAVKVLADNWSRDPEIRRRFRAEAVLLRRVQAGGSVPGLIEVYDIDETDSGQPYMVMGYADQGTLADRCRSQRWSPADVVPVIHALAETVGALHDNQIVHRDLKPTNLLIRSDSRAATSGPGRLVAHGERLLVADLGLARDLRRDATAMSLRGGTRRYVAPEQLDARASVDQRADVHATSVVIAELLHEPGPDGALGRALRRGMATGPAERFGSMALWRDALLEAIELDGRPSEPTTRSGRGRRAVWITAGLTGLAGLAGLVALTTRLDTAGAIVGPGTIMVGEAVRYRAPEHLDRAVEWIGPNGEDVRDEDLEVRAVVPGELRIELTADGERTSRTIVAVASPEGPRVSGPAQARLDESFVLRPAEPGAGQDHYWLDADGLRVDGEELRLTPTSVGRLSVVLVARGPDGIERGVRHHVEVIP